MVGAISWGGDDIFFVHGLRVQCFGVMFRMSRKVQGMQGFFMWQKWIFCQDLGGG